MAVHAPPTDRRPELVDALTGLATRHGFARAVDQADRDRDRMVVAVVAIDGLAEVNRFSGHHAGDDLLRALARPLAERASVDVTTARLGGTTFGLLWAPADDHRPGDVLAPVLDELRAGIDRWRAQRSALGTPSPVRPEPVAGLAAGHDGEVWARAELALEAALGDTAGPSIAVHDPDDPALADHRRRQRLVGELAESVDRADLAVATGEVEALQPEHAPGWRWVHLALHLPNAGRPGDAVARGGVSATELSAAPGLAAAIDHRLIERAADLRRSGVDRVTVAPLGPLVGPRSIIDPTLGWPPGLLLEVEQARLAQLPIAAARGLADRLAELGWDLVIADFDGGLGAWRMAERLGARHLLLDDGLIGDGTDDADRAVARLLAATVASAWASDHRLLAHHGIRDDGQLAKLGLDLVVRPAVV